MSQRITTRCPSCRSKYTVGAEAAGKKAKCAKCGSRFRIPRPKLTLEDQILEWLADAEQENNREEQLRPRPKPPARRKPPPRVDRSASDPPADRVTSKASGDRIKPKLTSPPEPPAKKAAG